MKKSKIRQVKVTHNAPGKKGKQEQRAFKTLDDAVEYIKRNEKRLNPSK